MRSGKQQQTVLQNQYQFRQLLGQGQFGKVYKAYSQLSPSPLAIKVIKRNKFRKQSKLTQLLEREIDVLKSLTHPNIVQFIDLIVKKEQIYMVYQYCQGGTLQDKIPLPQSQATDVVKQIIQGLKQAQKKGIIHRDLKPANILFKQGKIKIADWGFSRYLIDGETTSSFIGSPAYMAPEVLKQNQYTISADIWSLGILYYQILTGYCPWRSTSISQLCRSIEYKPLNFPSQVKISQKTKSIIELMLKFNQQQRPTFRQLNLLFEVQNKKNVKSSIIFQQKNNQQLAKRRKEYQQQKIIKTPLKTQRQEIKTKLDNQKQKILGCVYFLQIIQDVRKNRINNRNLYLILNLIEQNLLFIKPKDKQKQNDIIQVWKKQMKIIKQMKNKIKNKQLNRNKSESILNIKVKKQQKCILTKQNPQGNWQEFVRETINISLQLLQKSRNTPSIQKQKMLLQVLFLLDLIIFRWKSQEFTKRPLKQYLSQLQQYQSKDLLKSINNKLLLLNKHHY